MYFKGVYMYKDELQKNAKEVIYALEPFHLEEWLEFVCVQSALYTCLFHSLMLHSVARMLVIHCITVYKQQSPSLHRQHYCAIWCVGVMSCTLSCLPARPLPSNRHHTYRIVQNTELKAKKCREGNRMWRLTIIAVTVAAWCAGKVKEEKLRIGTQPVGRETSDSTVSLFGSEAAIVWRHYKWCLTDKHCQRSWENRHLHVAPRHSLMYKRIQWAEIRVILC